MSLKSLAEKAARLPELDFDWPGPEQFDVTVFERDAKTHEGLQEYVARLRMRMREHTAAIATLKDAYMSLRDIILEAEVVLDR